jgi:type III secretion protein V
LLKADAGEVIRAFGNFVVSGNYVVGAVIFVILALIQFVVIAKGSERVAEVGARFTLDAMPGKQMAIDAELRSGSLNAEEATRRRRTLERESQFYGAMDGAMKFVRGDVIASFIITLINIVAGLAIGVGQRGMELPDALKRYGLLTIGDGLISQIPALIIATSAGILVTRVASENEDTALGEDLSTQIFGAPRALRVASLFILFLAAVPGLPWLPFLVIGVLLWMASRPRARRVGDGPSSGGASSSRLPAPWSLGYSPSLEDRLGEGRTRSEADTDVLVALAGEARERLFRRLGVILPACRLARDEKLKKGSALLSIREVPAKTLDLPESLGPDEEGASRSGPAGPSGS